ncbi:restriction endonuclease subunit S [Salmonella enterica subsp. enterica serovar Ouakam]|uniref:restriction endonuclease subunit S n=1 Tax=Salmonella enterica TaxID=28901 RepID=UPI0026DC1ADF|nr:restriction endonuclease subunit S [Salmonella enterica]EHJ5305960.1 restriction endonuclease subunit S [Salmonella enterica subsp. enterica serovar Ouakam]EIE1666758.1 restriction endonuclease subunit S [Salmonella enterica]MDO4009623.1 restriction endonuclease subunit S [Salmonella enterica]
MAVEKLIVDHIDTWTTALQTRSTAGRGSSGKIDLYGIKKLRELILELAVRGKLVPQDPNDEPASVLLKRIAAEKAELVKQGKIKKPKPLPEISEEEKPFELPVGWEWARLGILCKKLTDGSHNPPKDAGNGYPMLSSQNIQDGYIDIENPSRYVSEDDFEKENARTLVQKNDVLLTIVGSIGRSAVVLDDKSFVLQRSVAVIDTSLYSHFISNFFKAITAQNYFIENGKGTAQKGIYLGQLSLMLIPVPSLGEQKRISDRLNELMILCDQLEQHSLASLDAHQQLVETLLTTLTDSQNADELAENWVRISEHFDTLFTTEASIDALKQTILQLAVMGKLVQQDPNDEPASELLKRIAQEKAQLVKDGKMKKQKPLPPISDEEKPFELPNGWEWCRIGNLVNIRPELVAPDEYQSLLQVAPDIIEKGTGKVTAKRTVKESGVKGPNSRFYKGQIVYSKIRPSLSKAFLAEYDGLCSADMYPLDCFIDRSYLLKSILSEFFLIQVRQAENRIKMPKLNVESFSNILVTVPPSNEQQKIIMKLAAIDAFCDKAKSLIQSAQQTQLHLADALTDAAIN